MEADLLNLILRRQSSAAKAIDEDLRARPGHALQLLRHFVRIVRQRIDLILRERLRKPVVTAIRGALILDDDGLFDRRQGEPQRGAVLATAHVEGRREGAEAVGRCLHLVGAGIQVLENGDAAVVDRHRLFGAATIDNGHFRDDERRFGLIEHRDSQRRPDTRPLHHLPAFAAVGSYGEHRQRQQEPSNRSTHKIDLQQSAIDLQSEI